MEKLELTIDEIESLTGPIMGRPKSATFRTTDVVGLDTMINVANGLYQNVPNDKAHALFQLPGYVLKMKENNWLGDKTKQGFYKKVKGENGKSDILALDLKTLEYRPQEKVKSATLDGLKLIDKQKDSIIILKDSQIDLFKQKDQLKDQKIGNLELIITKKDEQFGLERQKSESLLKELKGQRTKTFFYKVGSFLGIIMTSLYLLK